MEHTAKCYLSENKECIPERDLMLATVFNNAHLGATLMGNKSRRVRDPIKELQMHPVGKTEQCFLIERE
jgi:hypothetical protein